MMEVINPNQSIGMFLIFVSLIFLGNFIFVFDDSSPKQFGVLVPVPV